APRHVGAGVNSSIGQRIRPVLRIYTGYGGQSGILAGRHKRLRDSHRQLVRAPRLPRVPVADLARERRWRARARAEAPRDAPQTTFTRPQPPGGRAQPCAPARPAAAPPPAPPTPRIPGEARATAARPPPRTPGARRAAPVRAPRPGPAARRVPAPAPGARAGPRARPRAGGGRGPRQRRAHPGRAERHPAPLALALREPRAPPPDVV